VSKRAEEKNRRIFFEKDILLQKCAFQFFFIFNKKLIRERKKKEKETNFLYSITLLVLCSLFKEWLFFF